MQLYKKENKNWITNAVCDAAFFINMKDLDGTTAEQITNVMRLPFSKLRPLASVKG